jgi:calnexin
MFGPDKCGQTDKVHFIFRHKSPKTGLYEEKHLQDPPATQKDKLSHLYTLVVRPDNSFEILIDTKSVKKGNLLSDFTPAVNPPKEIDDPTDIKPTDWVDLEKIDDPNATKPDDWNETEPEYIRDVTKLNPPDGWLPDEPKFVPDTSTTKPPEWEDEIYGEWGPPQIPNPRCAAAPGCGEYDVPLIKNPLYKGKWGPPKIPNPEYKGPWKARQISNPNFFEDIHPHNFEPILGAGFELWTVDKDVGIGNVFIGTDEATAYSWNSAHFALKSRIQQLHQVDADNADEENMDVDSGGSEAEKNEKGKVKDRAKGKAKSKRTSAADSDDDDKVGFATALGDVADAIGDAFMELFYVNPFATMAIVVVVVCVPFIPLLVCFLNKCVVPRLVERELAKERAKAKDKVKEEEKPIEKKGDAQTPDKRTPTDKEED